MSGGGQRRAGRRAARSAARLAAVQGLYQIDLSGADTERVLAEFESYTPGERLGVEGDVEADREFFAALIDAAVERREEFDRIIRDSLSERWKVERLAYVLRAILRTAVCELETCRDTPARVVINEYLDIAHAFFDSPEAGMVNGVLDDVARALRPGELETAETAPAGGDG